MKKNPIVVYCDGLCEPNPGGIATFGWVAYKGNRRIKKTCALVRIGPGSTNNLAEYASVVHALEWLLEKNYRDREIVIRTDSQLVVRQINGEYAIRSLTLIPLRERAILLAGHFPETRFESTTPD